MTNSDLPIGQILLTRALNATRPTYFPSYLGLRLVGSQMPIDNTGYLERMIVRRLRAGETWSYRRFQLYKGTTISRDRNEHVYRDCLAPSPSTAIAETIILAFLANDPAFRVPERAYSYRWPKTPFSGGSYEYFAEGYKQRNIEIASLLGGDRVAIVTDIRGFYPSVSFEQIESVLRARLTGNQTQLRDSAEEILEFYRGLIKAGGKGIPIGPESAHVLGHLVLEGVDKELTDKFGLKYFRYVDDIVVIADKAEQRNVEKFVASSLRRHGFEPNTDKTIALSLHEWERSVLRSDVSSIDTFRSFTSDLTVYLAFHPKRADEIKASFAKNGLAIPVSRLLAISKYSRFRYFLRRRKAPEGLGRALSIWLSRSDDFVERALTLKTSYEQTLASLVDEPYEKDPSLRRWQVQRIRRVVNTLFYLRDFAEWKGGSGLELFPELIEQRALSEALSSGSVNPVLPFYGRGPSAFAELWREYGNNPASIDWPENGFSSSELESVIALCFQGTLDLASKSVEGPQARLMGIATNDAPKRRTVPDLSFEDELESLRLSWSNQELAELARARYSLTESTALDALALMSSEYRS